MPAPQTGSPMTYMLNGRQYLVVAISGPGYSGELLALRVPAAAPPPPAPAGDRFPAAGGDLVITPLIHSSLQIEHAGTVIQVDPVEQGRAGADETGGSHRRHRRRRPSPGRRGDQGAAQARGAGRHRRQRRHSVVPDGIVLANGQSREVAGVRIEAVGAYDVTPGESFHPKGEANGYVLTVGGKRIYLAGVTECVPEVRAVTNVDIAFFAMNVPAERMEPAEAVECLSAIKPKVVYPYHYDQEWVRRLDRDGTRPPATTRGLQALKDGLAPLGVEVRVGDWYPPQ